jgi:lipoprotein LpqS
VRYNDAPAGARRHAVIALLVVLVVLAAGTGWKLTEHNAQAHHGPHALSSSIFNDFAAIVEHPHAQDGSAPVVPDAFAEAALPRSVTLLVALGLVTVIGAAVSSWATGASVVIRGPPKWGGYILAGQQLLIRLCTARR